MQQDNLLKHFLFPGTLFVQNREHLVTTVLGSCVAVCLWDASTGTGGINHYMLPLWNGEGLPTPKYGTIAIEKLLEKMFSLGCRQESLVAKVFGGANVMENMQGMYSIGDRNVQLARELLAEKGIPIAGADTGGRLGRKLIFNTHTGVVLVGKCQGSTR